LWGGLYARHGSRKACPTDDLGRKADLDFQSDSRGSLLQPLQKYRGRFPDQQEPACRRIGRARANHRLQAGSYIGYDKF
jgi:hypothetical protein